MSKNKRKKVSQKKVSQMNKAERENAVRANTNIPGKWVTIDLECPQCTKDEYVYILDDNKTCYCLQCDLEFDVYDALEMAGSDLDMVKVTPLDDPFHNSDRISEEEVSKFLESADNFKKEVNGNTYRVSSGYRGGNYQQRSFPGYENRGYSYSKLCSHPPQKIINGADGWEVWAGKKEDCLPHLGKFDIVINLTWISLKDKHDIPIPELSKWENYGNDFKEIRLDWPDYGVTNLPKQFWLEFIDYVKANNSKVLVCCQGGHGRTGTAIAVMLVLAMRYAPQEAINWVRLNYCDNAIETVGQENYIKSMDKREGNVEEASASK